MRGLSREWSSMVSKYYFLALITINLFSSSVDSSHMFVTLMCSLPI